jgi:hypothetical protein
MAQRYVNPAADGTGDGTTPALTGANGAFVSMNAAAAALDNTQPWDVECATTGGVADTTQVLSLTGSPFGLTEANRIRFYPAPDHEALASGWDTNRYRLSSSATLGVLFAVDVPNIIFENLQLECTADDNDGEIVRISGETLGESHGVQFVGCRLRGAATNANPREAVRVTSTTGKVVLANCVVERFATLLLCHFPGANTRIVVHNCTGAGVSGGNGVEFFGSGLDATTVLSVRNTILFGYDVPIDATLGGASDVSSNNLTTDPTFTNAGAGDYTVGGGSAAEDAGANLSADASFAVTDDIAGTARPQGAAYDIGAFEIPAGGGALHTQSFAAASTNAGDFVQLSRGTDEAFVAASANSGAWAPVLLGDGPDLFPQTFTAASANSGVWGATLKTRWDPAPLPPTGRRGPKFRQKKLRGS